MSFALLLAPRGAERAGVVSRLVAAMSARGLRCAGVVQETLAKEGTRTGHVARRLGRSESVPLARHGAEAKGQTEEAFCSFVFATDAFATVRGWLAEDATRADVVVIDEVSKLEAAGRGHHDAVRDLLARTGSFESVARDAVVLLVVRADQLFWVVERFGLDEAVATLEVTAADDDAVRAFADEVARARAGALG